MAFRDLREWIKCLEQHNEIAHVTTEVDWNLELGGIVEEVFRKGGPALLFENIKDYKTTRCTKLFTASLSTYSRLALMLDCPKDSHPRDLINRYIERTAQQIAPVMVDSGPVKENKVVGDQINLWDFPAPLWHHLDGGRYIGTFDGVVTKDPESGWVNVGLYRRMIHDRNHLGIAFATEQHIWRHFRKWRSLGKPMPVAIVTGWDPVLPAIAASPQAPGMDEFSVMGSLRGAPVELVKCETLDLAVPATAEIVFEGEISTDPSTFRTEGPFGEYTGYYTTESSPKPVIEVKCITHRNNPILQGTMEGIPINEDHRLMSIINSAVLLKMLKTYVPGVTAVNVHPSTGWTNVFVQVDNSYIGQVPRVAHAIWGTIPSLIGKNIIVVDKDIDIFDVDQVLWALAYRVDPSKDFIISPSALNPLDPIIHPDDRPSRGANLGHKWLIDATKPITNKPSDKWWGQKFAPVSAADPETLERVRKRWSEYGIG